MSTQPNFLTVGQARTIRQEGGVELATRHPIGHDRYTFANHDELTASLYEVRGGQLEGGDIRGAITRKGTYSRRVAGQAHA